jgi:hypothetical protein
MQITTAALFLFAVISVAANLIESQSNSIDAGDDGGVLFKHRGVSKSLRPIL